MPKKKKRSKSRKSPASPKIGIYPWIALLAVIGLCIAMYAPSLNGEILTFDDNEYFEDYPEILNLNWHSVKIYFSKHYVMMYHPLPMLTLAINYHFTGLDTFPMHLFNLVFHLGLGGLVFYFLFQLSSNQWASAAAASLFLLHPMNTEAVSWISARSSVMYGFFYLASLIFYLKYIRSQGKWQWIALCALAFLLSLFSKAHAVTLPVVLLLFDWYYRRKEAPLKILLEKLPFFALSITFGLIALADSDTIEVINDDRGLYSVADTPFMASWSLSFYLVKFIAPIKQCAIYCYPPKTGNLLPLSYYLSPLLIAAVMLAVFKAGKYRRDLLFGIGFFLIGIALTLQVIPSRNFIVADRYSYIPYLGFFFIAIRFSSPLLQSKKWLILLSTIFLIVLATFSYQTQVRAGYWADSITLLNDIITKNPPVDYVARAYGNRGFIKETRYRDYEAAKNDYLKGIELDPTSGLLHYNAGTAFSMLGQHEESFRYMNRAIELNYKNSESYNYRGVAYFNLNQPELAFKDYQTALQYRPDNARAHNNLGTYYEQNGEYVRAVEKYTDAIKYDSRYAEAYRNRGVAWYRLYDSAKACADWKTALDLGDNTLQDAYKEHCS